MVELRTKNENIERVRLKLKRNCQEHFNGKVDFGEKLSVSFTPSVVYEAVGLSVCSFGPVIEWLRSFYNSFSLDKAFENSQAVAEYGATLMKVGLYLLALPAGVIVVRLVNVVKQIKTENKIGHKKAEYNSSVEYLDELYKDGYLTETLKDDSFNFSRTVLGEEAVGHLSVNDLLDLIQKLKIHRRTLLECTADQEQAARDNVIEFLEDNPRIKQKIKKTSEGFQKALSSHSNGIEL